MKRNAAFPSTFMAKEDVSNPLLLTIGPVNMEAVNVGDGASEDKPVLHWLEQGQPPLIVNTTNWNVIENLYGDDSDGWHGKQIVAFNDPNVQYAGRMVGGVRVKAPDAGAQAPAAAPVAVPPVEDNPPPQTPPAQEAAPAPQGPDDGGVDILSWDMAISLAGDIHRTKEDLVAHLKGLGNAGYDAQRDTAAVRSWLASQAPGKVDVPEGDIPF